MRLAKLLEGHEKVQGCEVGDNVIRVVLKSDVEDYSDLPKLLIQSGIDLRQFSEEELDSGIRLHGTHQRNQQSHVAGRTRNRFSLPLP